MMSRWVLNVCLQTTEDGKIVDEFSIFLLAFYEREFNMKNVHTHCVLLLLLADDFFVFTKIVGAVGVVGFLLFALNK